MTPTEVLEELAFLGITVSRSTLLRYERSGLIQKPSRGGLGRGLGRSTDYNKNTPFQFYVAWRMQKHFNRNSWSIAELLKVKIAAEDERDSAVASLNQDLVADMSLYIGLTFLALLGFHVGTPLLVYFSHEGNSLKYASWPQNAENINGAIKYSRGFAPNALKKPQLERWNSILKRWEPIDTTKVLKSRFFPF